MIAVVDYGIGNLHSAHKALSRLGADARLTDDPALIGAAAGVVLPGVGAFGACMTALRARRLEAPVLDAAALGPAVPRHLRRHADAVRRQRREPRSRRSRRDPGRRPLDPGPVKRPQMQWNVVDVHADDPLFAGLGAAPWFYFVHSLHGVPDDPDSRDRHRVTTAAR